MVEEKERLNTAPCNIPSDILLLVKTLSAPYVKEVSFPNNNTELDWRLTKSELTVQIMQALKLSVFVSSWTDQAYWPIPRNSQLQHHNTLDFL